jgi:hypothetical protein
MLRPNVTSVGPDRKVAAFLIDFYNGDFVFKSSNPDVLARPYISLNASRAVNYALDTTQMQPFDQNFGPIKSLGFVYRPNFNAGQDYAEQGINLLEALPKVIIYNRGNGQTVHIETGSIPAIDVATAAIAGFYTANDIVVQGCIPFFGNVTDTLEFCYLAVGATNLGKLHLNLYNFDVAPFQFTTYSNFVKSA